MAIGHDSGSPAKKASDRERVIRKALKEQYEVLKTTFKSILELEKQLNNIFK